MHKLILSLICIGGLGIHVFFLELNEVLKVADSFAYLKMSSFLGNFDVQGFGSGWFGFLYSAVIAGAQSLIAHPFLAALYANIALFAITAALLYKLASYYLDRAYLYLLLILFFLSPSLLHYNIHVLSENLYIPLFLCLCITLYRWGEDQKWTQVCILSFILALLYLTRAEAFIYLGAIYLVMMIASFRGDINWSQMLRQSVLLTLFFGLFISPYVYYLSTITGDIGLTNKGSSNLRQAQLRGIDHMDDIGFERAVAELTDDKQHLIAGFAGGMEYDRPSIEGNIKDYVVSDPMAFLSRVGKNQIKLYSETIPKMLFGSQLKLYYDSYYQNDPFRGGLILILFPIIFIVFGVYRMICSPLSLVNGDRSFVLLFTPLFLTASLFFTLFFVLERYFIVFLPLALIVLCYGIQYMLTQSSTLIRKWLYFLLGVVFIIHGTFGLYGYYQANKQDDSYYSIKKTAGTWMKIYLECEQNTCLENDIILDDKTYNIYTQERDFKILERFPIVTFYSGTQYRYITPYTSQLSDIITYAKYHGIDVLVVDTLDFAKYRPELAYLLDETKQHEGLSMLKTWKLGDQKVILYKIIY